jgi:hypothetical protein
LSDGLAVRVALVDVVAVLAFAAVGRSLHTEGLAALGVLSTAGPFLIGLLAGWLAALGWRSPLRLVTGSLVWAGTVVVGLAVRTAFIHRLPPPFVLVAAVSLAVFLLGWRVLAAAMARRRRRTP